MKRDFQLNVLRPCAIQRDEYYLRGIFHGWVPSDSGGRRRGDEKTGVVALVETTNGRMTTVAQRDVCFFDTKDQMERYSWPQWLLDSEEAYERAATELLTQVKKKEDGKHESWDYDAIVERLLNDDLPKTNVYSDYYSELFARLQEEDEEAESK